MSECEFPTLLCVRVVKSSRGSVTSSLTRHIFFFVCLFVSNFLTVPIYFSHRTGVCKEEKVAFIYYDGGLNSLLHL